MELDLGELEMSKKSLMLCAGLCLSLGGACTSPGLYTRGGKEVTLVQEVDALLFSHSSAGNHCSKVQYEVQRVIDCRYTMRAGEHISLPNGILPPRPEVGGLKFFMLYRDLPVNIHTGCLGWGNMTYNESTRLVSCVASPQPE